MTHQLGGSSREVQGCGLVPPLCGDGASQSHCGLLAGLLQLMFLAFRVRHKLRLRVEGDVAWLAVETTCNTSKKIN